MTTTTLPSSYTVHRASALTLVLGVVVSVLIHLGVGLSASGYFSSHRRSSVFAGKEIEIEPDAARVLPPHKQLELGMDTTNKATINWLGVVEDPQAGDAPIGEVDQAQFTQQQGDAPVSAASEPAHEPSAQEAPSPPISAPQPTPEIDDATPQERTPEESAPAESVKAQVDLEPKPNETTPAVLDPQPEPIKEPSEAEKPEPDSQVEAPAEHPPGPSLVSHDPSSKHKPTEHTPEETPEETQTPITTPTTPAPPTTEQPPAPKAQSPSQAGTAGMVSDRESTASIIKRAIKVDAKALNKPIVGKGLEITTIEPRFPASVRFTQRPNNPVLLIRFDATGRVRKVHFLRDGRRLLDTGSEEVNEPLLSAIYKWRAKGKEIDALDASDPESSIEISMRILFSKERKKP